MLLPFKIVFAKSVTFGGKDILLLLVPTSLKFIILTSVNYLKLLLLCFSFYIDFFSNNYK